MLSLCTMHVSNHHAQIQWKWPFLESNLANSIQGLKMPTPMRAWPANTQHTWPRTTQHTWPTNTQHTWQQIHNTHNLYKYGNYTQRNSWTVQTSSLIYTLQEKVTVQDLLLQVYLGEDEDEWPSMTVATPLGFITGTVVSPVLCSSHPQTDFRP